ncbi:hypothetical protein [Niveispirillum sp. SYP-B3756]|uniref:hypothetical protein n=1 Tax=Niveispirillum sp. SYP-B3756 TaxID=2662178 RepID=UPI001FFEC08C|nr:hypothetical protein [Niveispirillum sp. SYP-B3756]
MGKVMGYGHHRYARGQLSGTPVPVVAVMKVAEIRVLYDQIQIFRANPCRLQAVSDGDKVIASVIFLAGDPFLFDGSNDLTVAQ